MAVTTTTNLSCIGETLEIRNLLCRLDPILGANGCIRSAHEVPKILSIMKEADTMLNKCIVLNVIQTTKAQSTLTKFMDGGGWTVLNSWLSEGKKSHNVPLLVEILQVLTKLPVTIAALKQGNMGKLVKQLSKHEAPEVKNVASDLLEKWMTIFRQGQAARSKEGSGSISDGHEIKKEKSSKKSKKEIKSPVELQPPLGPLVALGKPRDRLKRPRDLALKMGGLGTQIGSNGEKRTKTSPIEDDIDKTDKTQKGITESSSFMNALSSQVAAKWQEKRVKKIKGVGAKPSPTQTKAPVEVGENGGNMEVTSPIKDISLSVNSLGPESMEEAPQQDNSDITVPSSVLKKRVSWASDESLVIVHYFEMDESERGVNRSRSFLDAAQQEKLMEREAMSSRIMFDQLMEMAQWHRPVQYHNIIKLVEKGSESEQKKIQIEREQKVLAQLFLSKASVPPTPSEPDPEPEQTDIKPKLIPLMEPGAVDTTSVMFQPPGTMMGGPPINFPPPESPLMPPMFPVNGSNNMPLPPPPHGPPDPSMMMGEHGVGIYGFGQSNIPPPGGSPFQYYQEGGGGMSFRGMRGRGRGRGRSMRSTPPNICKHYITHGCRLGNACRFLHITPEELAVKMSQEKIEEQSNSSPNSNTTDTK